MPTTDDVRIREIKELAPPSHLLRELPCSDRAARVTYDARQAIHLLELRSAPQGHPSYRRVATEMHRQIGEVAGHRAIAAAMVHMGTDAPALDRLESERRAEQRRDGGAALR